MPSFWKDLFAAPRPTSRSGSRAPSRSRALSTSSQREPFVYVQPAAAPSNIVLDDSSHKKRSRSNPPAKHRSYAIPPEPEIIHVRTPKTSSLSMKSGKSAHLKSHSVSFGSSTLTNSSQSFNGYNYDPQQLEKHDYHSSSHRPRGRSMSMASVRVHPLLAISRHRHPSLTYDVVYTPSSRSVIDRDTGTDIPLPTLSEPAVYPAFPTRLVLRSEMLPWPILVFPTQSKHQPRFYIASSKSSSAATPIAIIDILWALHNCLNIQVTSEEWDSLGEGSRAQKKITRAYDDRCQRMGGFESGVRRVDWLGSRTILSGLELVNSGNEGEFEFDLFFSRAG